MSDPIDYKFWVAISGATIFKMVTSPWTSPTKAAIKIASAIFCAWVFTDPIMDFWGWHGAGTRDAVAAALALIGENGMRWLLRVTPENLIDIWRGK